jgi:hypothetical protein
MRSRHESTCCRPAKSEIGSGLKAAVSRSARTLELAASCTTIRISISILLKLG